MKLGAFHGLLAYVSNESKFVQFWNKVEQDAICFLIEWTTVSILGFFYFVIITELNVKFLITETSEMLKLLGAEDLFPLTTPPPPPLSLGTMPCAVRPYRSENVTHMDEE